MKTELKHKIKNLKSQSFDEIDHISILQNIYDDYKEGNKELYLLARYFINGIDDLPNLKQKSHWNQKVFDKQRKLFYENHHKLIEIIETYYDLEEDEKLIQEFHSNENLKMIWIEKKGKKNGIFKRYYDDTQIAVMSNYQNGKRIGSVKEWYSNGILAEEGKYINNEYVIEQFWDNNGTQLLINGTGKTIRYYGTNGDTVYEQYFEEYIFKGEKRIK